MSATVDALLTDLQNPRKEMGLVRKGMKPPVVEAFLKREGIAIKDVLDRLNISSSTYFARKKSRKPLDSHSTEKFIHFIQAVEKAREVLGNENAKAWLYSPIPALGNDVPVDLLDTEAGFRLVEQTLHRIQYGIYG